MDIMVIGGGGREHAIIRALKKSPLVSKIYALPGNGGISLDAECVPVKATDLDGIVEFTKTHKIDFAAVIPDDPLALGLCDRLRAMGIPCFGPSAAAAKIESSKAFAKDLMKRYGIPTAKYEVFTDEAEAVNYIKTQKMPIVIKADGLALGKGVIIAETQDEAIEAIDQMMSKKKFGASGTKIVIEEFLTGTEVSVLTFTDGKTVVQMPASMDHKRALDGDKGLNTGGMGAIAPNPYYTDEAAAETMKKIIIPTIEAMKKEDRKFKGCLYFGLMLTDDGPKVIEYNCRFGDPETQVVLPLLESDLMKIMLAVENETLSECEVKFSGLSCCCVVLASGGYPVAYEKGKLMDIPESENIEIFHAGTKLTDGKFYTSGGRVLGVTAVRDSLEKAIKAAYAAAEKISFDGVYMRHDIGKRALAYKK